MINIYINKNFEKLLSNVAGSLSFVPVKVYKNMLTDKDSILNDYNNQSGIYLIHNLVNGKQYVGSAINLKRRLYYYYSPSKLIDNRHISNSIIKYGHNSFTISILELVEKNDNIKVDLLNKEQYNIDLLKLVLNINPRTGSSLGFKHSDENKALLAKLRTGKPLSDETKQLLSELFSGELNPFWGKLIILIL